MSFRRLSVDFIVFFRRKQYQREKSEHDKNYYNRHQCRRVWRCAVAAEKVCYIGGQLAVSDYAEYVLRQPHRKNRQQNCGRYEFYDKPVIRRKLNQRTAVGQPDSPFDAEIPGKGYRLNHRKNVYGNLPHPKIESVHRLQILRKNKRQNL